MCLSLCVSRLDLQHTSLYYTMNLPFLNDLYMCTHHCTSDVHCSLHVCLTNCVCTNHVFANYRTPKVDMWYVIHPFWGKIIIIRVRRLPVSFPLCLAAVATRDLSSGRAVYSAHSTCVVQSSTLNWVTCNTTHLNYL